MTPGFNPEFDDTRLTAGWVDIPIIQALPARGPGGCRLDRKTIEYAEVFGRGYRLSFPMECRFLYDRDGRLWMSDTPQERIMMFNNGERSAGHVLVGGLGLGLYPQYALKAGQQTTRFTIIEQSPEIISLVGPALNPALDVPFEIINGDIESYLQAEPADCFDTIFLDTWDAMDAARLPWINRLRRLASNHLAPDGKILLWGYRWMVRLFEDACRALLNVSPDERSAWLEAQAGSSPEAIAVLKPVETHFQGRIVENLDQALAWCRDYIVNNTG